VGVAQDHGGLLSIARRRPDCHLRDPGKNPRRADSDDCSETSVPRFVSGHTSGRSVVRPAGHGKLAPVSPSAGRTAVYVECGPKRVFACAVDWPGWCRSGKDEERALEALGAYGPRYGIVAQEARVRFPPTAGKGLDVVQRVPGSATTDFGAPGAVAKCDTEPLAGKAAQRVVELVQASWTVFDRVVAGAPAELRKGPRGGGRDRDRIVEHVIGAEAVYARKLGVRHRQPGPEDAAAVLALREAIVEALLAPSAGEPLVEKGWPPRYAARRIAWHVLDHAWEIEDRSYPEGPATSR
jgi:hypothetical protein